MSLNLDTFVAIPLPNDLYAEFARRFPGSVSTVIEQVAQDFLDRTAEDFQGGRVRVLGVYWETLFLPEGTHIRTKHHGQVKTAEIVGTEICWALKVYPSMSQLASAMRGHTSNNAWKVLEIRRPNDPHWQIADILRR